MVRFPVGARPILCVSFYLFYIYIYIPEQSGGLFPASSSPSAPHISSTKFGINPASHLYVSMDPTGTCAADNGKPLQVIFPLFKIGTVQLGATT